MNNTTTETQDPPTQAQRVNLDNQPSTPLSPAELAAERERNPRYFRDQLALCVEATGTRLRDWATNFSCRQTLVRLGLGDIEQLVELAREEDRQSLGTTYTDAEKALQIARQKALDAEALVDAERSKARRREEIGRSLGLLRPKLASLMTEAAMQAEIDGAVEDLAANWFQNMIAPGSEAPENSNAIVQSQARLAALPLARRKLEEHITGLARELATLQPPKP
jgi:hypothetical protein